VCRQQLLLRSCKVLAHETGHILGLKHCIYHHCLMNGANHLGEFDSAPMFLCPVCLRKLLQATAQQPAQRYKALHAWYFEHGCTEVCATTTACALYHADKEREGEDSNERCTC